MTNAEIEFEEYLANVKDKDKSIIDIFEEWKWNQIAFLVDKHFQKN